MGRHFFLILFCIKTLVSLSFLFYQIYLKGPPPLPDLDLGEWWGDGPKREDTSVRDFKIKFDDEMIRDLKDRLTSHRPWTPPLEDAAFNYGFNSEQLEPWLRYLAEQYPFAEREEFLNQFPQYKTNIQGLDLHFIRVKPKVSEDIEVVPLLVLHGWPGSVREFYEAIPHLTAVSKDRDFALELIIPSLPGFGFSDATFRPGLGAAEMAVVLRNLMHRLGFKQFYLQGGDWGSIIGSIMATVFPKELLGFHNNMAITMSPGATYVSILGAVYPKLLVDEDLIDRMYPLKKFYMFLLEQTGYLHLQASKPDTIGVALSNSPCGHLAYILDLFKDHDLNLTDGGLTNRFTRDQLLDNFMIYWSSESITSSMRLYAETFNKRYLEMKIDEIPTSVPTGALQAKYEFSYQPPYLLKFKYENLLNCTVLDRGGHFIALELPDVFAEDVLKAISEFRKWHRDNDDVFVKEDL